MTTTEGHGWPGDSPAAHPEQSDCVPPRARFSYHQEPGASTYTVSAAVCPDSISHQPTPDGHCSTECPKAAQ